MIEPTGLFVGSPTVLPMHEVVQWLFEQHYGRMNGCARSKCFGSAISLPSPPNCTPVYNERRERK